MTGEDVAGRYCPLCDGETDAPFCPNDGTATLPVSMAAGAGDEEVEPGAVFAGRYRIERPLGEGGFGRVYVATQLSMDREVALKTLHRELLGDRHHVRRFYREARAASRLDSPHVVRMYDFGIDAGTGTPFLVMEYLKGRGLEEVMAGGAALSPQRAARVAGQVALALAEAHEAGIVHRDLKPANVFLLHARGGREFVKVMDFGIAKVLRHGGPDTGESLTATGTTVGTPRYMSPEQAMAEKVDFRSDLYALGCILHEMLMGGPVFEAEDKVSLLLKHVTAEPPRLPERLPGDVALPVALGVLHEALLAKMRDKRPADCRVVADICEAVEQGRDVDAQAMLIEARTRSIGDVALAETMGPPPEATVSMGPAGAEGAGPAGTPAAGGEPSTVVTPGTPGPAVVPLSARATAPAELQDGARVETTDGNPSVGMGSADLAALRRAAQGPFRSRAWLGVLVVLAAGAAVVAGFVGARPDETPGVRSEPVGGRIEAAPSEPVRAVTGEASAPEAMERGAVLSQPEKAAPPPAAAAKAHQRAAQPVPSAPESSAAASSTPEKTAVLPKTVPAHVVIRSRPTGAAVNRGDVEICRTPCDLSLPPEEQPVRLRLERRGRKPTEVVLKLRPGGDILRDVVLEPLRSRRRTSRVTPKPAAKGQLPGIRPTGATENEGKPKPAEPLPGIRMTR